jgi:GH25 family lysozyme M1 (1,4-beta-N-acetylmuramidase)
MTTTLTSVEKMLNDLDRFMSQIESIKRPICIYLERKRLMEQERSAGWSEDKFNPEVFTLSLLVKN